MKNDYTPPGAIALVDMSAVRHSKHRTAGSRISRPGYRIPAATPSGSSPSQTGLPSGRSPRPPLVQRAGVVQAAVLHHVADAVRVPDAVERVGFEDDEVGQLARLDGAEVAVQADGLRSQRGGDAQRVVLRQAARLRGPQLPVVAEPLELPWLPTPATPPASTMAFTPSACCRKTYSSSRTSRPARRRPRPRAGASGGPARRAG